VNERELLGATAVALIEKKYLGSDASAEGQTRLLLDRLSDAQVAAICRAILAHPELAAVCRLRIPRDVGRRTGLPEEALTDERATFWRSRRDPERRVVILANADDEQGQSLKDLTPIGSDALFSEPALWVACASAGLDLPADQLRAWTVAVETLLQLRNMSVDRFAEYVVATRDAVLAQGLPLENALGYALPALRAPRDRTVFGGIAGEAKGQAAKWRAAWKPVFQKRAPYLTKKNPSQQPVAAADLRDNFEKVRADIAPKHHEVFEAFIDGPPAWGEAARALAELEWESDNSKALFENLRKKRLKLGAATRELFEAKLPFPLTPDEEAYLDRLDGRSAREADEDDEAFYERHRDELGMEPQVKATWDRFVFGRPVETDDFRAGLLLAVERLFEQLGGLGGRKTLVIECARQKPRQWEEVNEKAAFYFAQRYRGLPALLGHDVRWEPANLFELAATDPERRDGKKPKGDKRRSNARAANQLKFTVHLSLLGEEDDAVSAQVLWNFEPQSILGAFAGDWAEVGLKPFTACAVTRETVSAKGRLQSLDLREVQTLMPVRGQDRGALLSRRGRPLDERFAAGLRDAKAQGWITPAVHDALAQRWEAFAGAYVAAVGEYLRHGTASNACLDLGDAYAGLLSDLVELCPGDRHRRVIWQPVLELGVAIVEGGDPASIIAPWHPLRLVAAAAKDRRLGGLVRYLLREESVEFGDSRLFFRDMTAELAHPFYPEVCLGYSGEQPVLLGCTDNLGEYSLMEVPTRRAGDTAADDSRQGTNEDPRRTAKVIKYVVGQFLDLYPHEAANLSVVLYNCDTVGLPEATVAMLGEMNGEDDDRPVRCHVQLRHTENAKLQFLYETLLESSARDSDSAVASESTRDFMAHLRVGIMASQTPTPSALDGMPADIVFLQDVVARLCTLEWDEQHDARVEADPRALVPSRWSRRRPAMRDDLHSTTDLCCPVQTPAGWSYLRALNGLVRGQAPSAASHPLPTRRVNFDDGRAKQILDDAHKLGQWVVNFDEILTRQHLRNLDVRIIRHRQSADGQRGVVVSSLAPLNMLHLLVQRNLRTLGLDLRAEELVRLSERLVTYASEVSGDIVLRAARRSPFAHELIGLALSRYLLDDELGAADLARGWYFLDDYAEWLGQREEHIADILALSPRRDADGRATLVVLVSEAKYVSAEILQVQRAHSGSQARQTVARMEDALFNTPRRLDRDHWLGRLGDLLGESVVASQAQRKDLLGWQREIAAGRMAVELRGYSHVFVYAKSPDTEEPGDQRRLTQDAAVWQEVFGPDAVRRLLMAFHRDESPRPVRARLGDEAPWDEREARLPADGANWATSVATLDLAAPPSLPPPAPAKAEAKSKPRAPRAPSAAPKPVPPRAAPPPPPEPPPPPPTPASSDDADDAVDSAPPPRLSFPPRVVPPAPLNDGSPFGWASPRVAAILEGATTDTDQSDEDLAWLEHTAGALANALRNYRLQARLIGRRLTPNAALLRFQGSDQLTVSAIEQRTSQLLTTHGLRVIRVSAEPGAVVVSVERPHRELVSLPTVLRHREVDDPVARRNQRLVVGVRESDGSTLYLRPGTTHAPHTLIAGTTGSGKSVLLQNLLLDIAMTNVPATARITLIDPKQGVDYQLLEKLPHLDGGIVVEQNEAVAQLTSLTEEMDNRYRRFREIGEGVTNLAGYNKLVSESRRLPVRWLVHDEFAEWMLVDEYKKAVQTTVQRLGVKARAAGIFLVFAAQRPEDRVMPVQLRDNLGSRLILRVESEGTSRIALLEEGAERLLGKGQLAARLQEESDIVLAQVPMLGPEVMKAIVTALRQDLGLT
jgi:S-DNA-T family DNA segregation ATPase FtsK/SpoIIIE